MKVIIKNLVMLAGISITIIGVYLWYQSGFMFPEKGNPNNGGDSGVAMYLIILGVAVSGYGFFITYDE